VGFREDREDSGVWGRDVAIWIGGGERERVVAMEGRLCFFAFLFYFLSMSLRDSRVEGGDGSFSRARWIHIGQRKEEINVGEMGVVSISLHFRHHDGEI